MPAATLASLLVVSLSAATAAGTLRSEPADALRASLGLQGVVDVDPVTGTPRVVARLDGFLTEPTGADAVGVVLGYVQANESVFGLDEDDLAGLHLVRDETDAFGVRHLLWAQEAGGIQAFANDLRASVTSDGRIVNVLGSPLPDLELPAESPSVSGGEAVANTLQAENHSSARVPRRLAAPRGIEQATRFAGGHSAELVLVATGRGVRLAWHVTAAADSDEVYTSLVDAESGEVLRSENKVEQVSGLAWDSYPGAASGGTQSSRNFTALGWLSASAERLNGANAHVFSDWNDNDHADDASGGGGGGVGGNEETDPTLTWTFNDFTQAAGLCAPAQPSVCSWDSNDNGPFPQPPGWYQNRRQNAIQVFYFVNRFHDHLESSPDIAWTTRNFEEDDKVVAQAGDGADTGVSGQFLGLHMPDAAHINNANMFTPPDGQSPTMQMYLFTSLTGNVNTDPTPDVNGGDDAAVVYHEYAHGLSNRLVTYANGWGALDSFQSGAMGEAWSDWYAMDFLVNAGFAPNTGAVGDVKLDRYVGNNRPTIRTEGLDCPVVTATAACPGGDDTGSQGGYTYGDMGHIWSGGPEVHADGEIWAQTLWDLRTAVGVADSRFLVTEAMRLSPANPSFLDMRNSILQANQVGVLDGRADREAAIWQVFATRGMGFFAATEDADDTEPIQSFALPPSPAAGTGSLAGVVTDADTGQPVAGVKVAFAGLEISDTTNVLGQYAIADVPVGTYPQVIASKARLRPRYRLERGHRRGHGKLVRLRRPPRLGRVRRRRPHRFVHRPELLLLRLRAGARNRPAARYGVVDDQVDARTDRAAMDHGEASRLRRRELVRGRPRRSLRRSRLRVRPGVQDRDVEDRVGELVDDREHRVVLARARPTSSTPSRSRSARPCGTSASRSPRTTATRSSWTSPSSSSTGRRRRRAWASRRRRWVRTPRTRSTAAPART